MATHGLAALEEFAFGLPGACRDLPWDDDVVAKVDKKIFAFFGSASSAGTPTIAVKLPASADDALATAGASPTPYGLGRHGWVTVPVAADGVPDELLREWIEESYRAIAPQRLVDELDAR